jgi:hypothetical protein
VVDELAATCTGKDRDELIWPAQHGGYLVPPTKPENPSNCSNASAVFVVPSVRFELTLDGF